MNIKSTKGFTLIELLVVIAIIGLLSSIIISNLADSSQKGRDTAKIQALQEVRNALQMYFSDNGYYPVGTDLTVLKSPKVYIATINSDIKYQGTDTNNTSTCDTGSGCASYHLGIALERTDNKVLAGDKDNTVGFRGDTDCGSTSSGPDFCYDITP
jgi:prepilin-type N-terminal cleavage/methylation domain-containing protein